MGRRSWLRASVVVALFVLLMCVPAVAFAGFSNTDCLTCHSDQQFDVGAVNYATACRKCHVDSLAGTHPYHNATANCGAYCHPGWGESIVAMVPSVIDTGGAFASSKSQATSPAILHIIHSQQRWPVSLDFQFSKCGSCHAVASCGACHEGNPQPDALTHAGHGSISPTSGITPWTGDLSSGVTGGNQTIDSHKGGQSVRCGASKCHNTSGQTVATPGLQDNMNHSAYPSLNMLDNVVTLKPTTSSWVRKVGIVYTGGEIVLSNIANATFETTFTGEQIALVADKDPYRGIAEIYIDNVSQGQVDLYQDTTRNQVEVFKSGALSGGAHRVKVRSTGLKNAAARGAYVSVDQFKIFATVPGLRAPKCTSCHPDRAVDHGSATFSHEASGTAGNQYKLGSYASYRCDSCHTMFMMNEHARSSSATYGKGCKGCHTVYAPFTWTNTWQTANGCGYSSCHTTGSAREPHAATTAAHAVTSDPAEAICRGCHSGDLASIHNNSISTNAFVTNCNTCHSQTKFPATKSCVDPTCHSASGVVSLATHSFSVPRHTSTVWSAGAQGTSPAIDAGGKECSACHTARLDQAHATTGIGAVSCTTGGTGNTGCHNNTSLNSMATASAAWPTDKCAECHNYGAAKSHDTTVAAHAIPAGTCGGTAVGCHTSTDLWVIHMKNQAGGAPNGLSCTNTGCHDATNVNKRPSLKTCGTGNACHTDKNLGNHPGAHNHSYSTASDYNAATETGCANSGANCHGTDTSRLDMSKPYHAATGCLGGVCHTSSSKPAYGGSNECVSCHDGNYVNAPDRVALNGPSSTGHYNETTHTATGTLFSAAVTAGGSASATCAKCHNASIGGSTLGLYNQHSNITPVAGSPYGSTVNCGECHNDTRSYGAAESTMSVKWTNNKCEDCHKLGGSAPMHAATAPSVTDTQTASCGSTGINCHNTTDLHAIHKNAAGGCNLTGCHDYTKQAYVPTGKSCGVGGSCHTTYTKNTSFTTHANSSETTAHAPTNTVQSGAAFLGNSCDKCHVVSKADGGLVAEHSLGTSTQTVSPGNVCRNCHNNAASTTAISSNWSAKDSSGGCAQCHTGTLAVHVDAASAKHQIVSAGCASSGAGCHPTNDLSAVGTPSTTNNIHSTCLRCHDRTASGGNMAYNPANKSCGSGRACHGVGTQYDPATSVHNGVGGLTNGDDATHHTASGMSSTITSGTATNVCSDCHMNTLVAEHAFGSTGAVSCNTGGSDGKGCHNSTAIAGAPSRVKDNWNNNSRLCQDCHSPLHNTIATSHTGSSTQGCGSSGAGCHTTSDLGLLHKNHVGGDGCRVSGCHDTANRSKRPSSKTCGSGGTCHTGYTTTSHGTRNGDEAVSHTASATAMAAKIDGASYSFGNACSNCHASTLQSAHTTVTTTLKSANAAWPATPPLCTKCHNTGTGGSPTTPDDAVTVIKTDNWDKRTCQQCHDTAANSGRGNGFHANYTLAKHTATFGTAGTGDGCNQAACHGTTDVRTIHNRVTSGCTAAGTDSKGWSGGCHAPQKQMAGVPMKCGSGSGGCHTNHTNANHGGNHLTALSQACVDCHENADVRNVHAAAPAGGCAVCHSNPTYGNVTTGVLDPECTNCHNATKLTPHNHLYTGRDGTSPHYSTNVATHTASVPTSLTGAITAPGGWGTNTYSLACTQCHSLEMWPEHASSGATFTTVPGTYADKCVACHEAKVDAFTGAWNHTCDACHATKHADIATRHNLSGNATLVASCGTPATDCHDLSDVSKFHAYDTNGDGDVKDAGEANCDACHVSAANRATTLDCTAAACHGANANWYGNATETNHRKYHETTVAPVADGAGAVGVPAGSRTTTEVDQQCDGCHEPRLDSDHYYLSLASGAFDGSATKAKNCAPCHYKTTASVKGTGSAVTSVDATASRIAIATDRHNCTTCHKNTTWNAAYMKMHESHSTSDAAAYNTEFNNTYAGHRSFSFMKGQNNTLGGGTTGSFPAAYPSPTFLSTKKLDGVALSATSMVHCDDCHTYTGANGPHGSTMTTLLVRGTQAQWRALAINSSGTQRMNNTLGLCAECHDLGTNGVHNDSNHNNIQCVKCHVAIPHAWKRPRLLVRYGTDVAPYVSTAWSASNALQEVKLQAYGSTWQKSDCSAGCSTGDHPNQTTGFWP